MLPNWIEFQIPSVRLLFLLVFLCFTVVVELGNRSFECQPSIILNNPPASLVGKFQMWHRGGGIYKNRIKEVENTFRWRMVTSTWFYCLYFSRTRVKERSLIGMTPRSIYSTNPICTLEQTESVLWFLVGITETWYFIGGGNVWTEEEGNLERLCNWWISSRISMTYCGLSLVVILLQIIIIINTFIPSTGEEWQRDDIWIRWVLLVNW